MKPTARIPLLTLQHAQTPYRGHWHFEGCGAEVVEATHTTVHRDHLPACVIERMQLCDRVDATRFARHLINHGWDVEQLHEAGESLLVLPQSAG
ncbi:MAG: hypothetical protein RLZZ124_1699 [Cyanobacteriota bacterium]|jgi:hypothetical protein